MTVGGSDIPEQPVHPLRDVEPPRAPVPVYDTYYSDVPISIDLGSYETRVGYANLPDPILVNPTLVSRYRDRKSGRNLTLVGRDAFLDPSAKSQAKSPYDGPLLANWDVVENLLDFSFSRIGVASEGRVANPIFMTEILGAPFSQRKNMYELLFEAFNVPGVSFGLDDLYSFHQNGGKTGVVIGAGHESTIVTPVINGKGILSLTKRINWGGRLASDYLGSILGLKYPYFPDKLNSFQMNRLIHDYMYVATDYQHEVEHYLDLDGLEKRDIVVEAPFVEQVVVQKSAEELAIQAEKRAEAGRRLQEQAAKKRLEKLIQREQEFEYYTNLQVRIEKLTNKRDTKRLLDAEGFKDETEMRRYIANLSRSLKRARRGDVGTNDDEVPEFTLLEIPDDQLDEQQIREKRKQRLMKANYDARMRAKREKEEERKRIEEEKAKDLEWRKTDLQGWIKDRRDKLEKLLLKQKEKKKLKEELSNRKSMASQMRMKNISALAADGKESGGVKGTRKRKGAQATIDNDPNDTFGANDDDWAVYRNIGNSDDEEIDEEEEEEIALLEKELLEHDPDFTLDDTREAQYDYRKSIIHLYLRGPRPFNPEDAHEQHQMHLNVERIRVPEVMFDPSMAGVDQAGVSEVTEDLFLRRLPNEPFFQAESEAWRKQTFADLLSNVFLTGGMTRLPNVGNRLLRELTLNLPAGSNIRIYSARDPMNDAWRGMSKFSLTDEGKSTLVSKAEYLEMGAEYIKEHRFGNVLY